MATSNHSSSHPSSGRRVISTSQTHRSAEPRPATQGSGDGGQPPRRGGGKKKKKWRVLRFLVRLFCICCCLGIVLHLLLPGHHGGVGAGRAAEHVCGQGHRG